MSARGWVHPVLTGLCFAFVCTVGRAASAQEAPPDAPALSVPATEGESPKPRPKRRPPAPRPLPKAAAPKATPAQAGQTAEPAAAGTDRPATDVSPVRASKAALPKPAAPPKTRPRVLAPAAAVPVPLSAAPAVPVQTPTALPPTPAALSSPPIVAAEPPSPCEARAALYDGEKGFSAFVTRIGRVQVENPLRPLTPEVTRVLQLSLAGKVATAYGPDLTALRRGGSPAVLESQLGGGIRWEPALPLLPETLTIVSEAGEPLARLAFRACTEAPAVKTPPAEARAKDRKPGARRPGAGEAAGAGPKTPPGFRLPQGAIAE